MTLWVYAFSIHAIEAGPETHSRRLASPGLADETVLINVVPELDARWSVTLNSWLVDPAPGIVGSDPLGMSSWSMVEANYLLAIESRSLAEPPSPGPQLQSLLIEGMRYITGLASELNDCNAGSGGGSCAALDDALLDLLASSRTGSLFPGTLRDEPP